MNTRTERHGQTEIGIISHNGREFAAIGASVNGRHVTGYIKPGSRYGVTALTQWGPRIMLECRCHVAEYYRHVNEFGDSGEALVFTLATRNGETRHIVGYSLGDGMLFRGELITGYATDDADYQAKQIALDWIERDEEQRAQDDYEASLDDDGEPTDETD